MIISPGRVDGGNRCQAIGEAAHRASRLVSIVKNWGLASQVGDNGHLEMCNNPRSWGPALELDMDNLDYGIDVITPPPVPLI